MFDSATVIVAVAVLESTVPSLALYVTVSVPLQSVSGVYVNVLPDKDVVPFDASVTMEYVRTSPSTVSYTHLTLPTIYSV